MSGLIQRLTARARDGAPASAIRPALMPRFAAAIDAEPSAQMEHADRAAPRRANEPLKSIIGRPERAAEPQTIRPADARDPESRGTSDRAAGSTRIRRTEDQDVWSETIRPTRPDDARDESGIASRTTRLADDRDAASEPSRRTDDAEGIPRTRPMRGDDATDDSGARFGWTPLADDDAAGSKMSRPTIDRTRPTDASDSTIDPPRLSLFAQLASIERDRSGASQPTATAGDEAEHEPADVPPRLTEHDDRAPIASAHEIAPERAPIATHARPRTPTVSSPPAPTTAATDAPVIRVTIGRIDVRAVTPPAPQAAPPAPRLRLTLDEYLRQRNGRQR